MANVRSQDIVVAAGLFALREATAAQSELCLAVVA
jgi:hypothetical protein